MFIPVDFDACFAHASETHKRNPKLHIIVSVLWLGSAEVLLSIIGVSNV